MEIIISEVQTRVPVEVFRLNGEFDANSARAFDEEARKAVQGGAQDVLLDLAKVDFMSSAGIRSISMLYNELCLDCSESERAAINKGIRDGTYKAAHLKLLKPSKRVSMVLQMAGLDMFLEIFDDERKALSSF